MGKQLRWVVNEGCCGLLIECQNPETGGWASMSCNEFGRIKSVSSRLARALPVTRVVFGDELYRIVRAYVAPHRGRYSNKFSPLRRAHCEAIATFLNENGIFPEFEVSHG